MLDPFELLALLGLANVGGWISIGFSLLWSIYALIKLYNCECYDSLPFQWATTVLLVFLCWAAAITRWNRDRGVL